MNEIEYECRPCDANKETHYLIFVLENTFSSHETKRVRFPAHCSFAVHLQFIFDVTGFNRLDLSITKLSITYAM